MVLGRRNWKIGAAADQMRCVVHGVIHPTECRGSGIGDCACGIILYHVFTCSGHWRGTRPSPAAHTPRPDSTLKFEIIYHSGRARPFARRARYIPLKQYA